MNNRSREELYLAPYFISTRMDGRRCTLLSKCMPMCGPQDEKKCVFGCVCPHVRAKYTAAYMSIFWLYSRVFTCVKVNVHIKIPSRNSFTLTWRMCCWKEESVTTASLAMLLVSVVEEDGRWGDPKCGDPRGGLFTSVVSGRRREKEGEKEKYEYLCKVKS